MPTDTDKTPDAKTPSSGDAVRDAGIAPKAKPDEKAAEPGKGSVGIPDSKAADPSRQPS